MQRFLFSLLALTAAAPTARAAEFLNPEQWEGLKQYWTVEGTTVTGESKEKLTFNTFLCSKYKVADFELKFSVRLRGDVGNSGIQIRSKIHDAKTFAVAGPQVDIGAGYWGSLYGEHFGGMMKEAPKEKVTPTLKKGDFNDYEIKCVGKHVTIMVNGITTVDDDFPKMPDDGIIAFQLHSGPAMQVTFRDVQFKEVTSAEKAREPKTTPVAP